MPRHTPPKPPQPPPHKRPKTILLEPGQVSTDDAEDADAGEAEIQSDSWDVVVDKTLLTAQYRCNVCNRVGSYPTGRDRNRHVASPEHIANLARRQQKS